MQVRALTGLPAMLQALLDRRHEASHVLLEVRAPTAAHVLDDAQALVAGVGVDVAEFVDQKFFQLLAGCAYIYTYVCGGRERGLECLTSSSRRPHISDI